MVRTLLLSLVLAGCQLDEPVLHAAPEPAPRAVPPIPPPPPVIPPPPAPSPWELITPGEFPDVYFAVSWSEFRCDDVYDADGTLPASDSDVWGPCPSHLAVVDLMGQVIAEFELPGTDDETPWWSGYNHLALEPAGPGRFLIVAETWGDDLDADADGFWQGLQWRGWIADAVDGSFTEVLRWTPETGYLHVVESGRLIPMDPWGTWIHVGVWPEDPDWLVIWGGEGNCANGGQGLTSLTMTHRSRPMDLGRMWSIDELLPPDLAERDGTLWPWAMQSGVDEEGKGQLLLGVADVGCTTSPAEPELLTWSPETGVGWRAQPGADTWPMEATFAGWGGGGALTTAPSTNYSVTPGRWRVSRPGDVLEGDLPLDRWSYRAGPMLDPAGPTFATIAGRSDAAGDAIDVFHRGERVWSIDHLRFGLQDRDVYLRDVVLLPAP
jgi:hypothetical protein